MQRPVDGTSPQPTISDIQRHLQEGQLDRLEEAWMDVLDRPGLSRAQVMSLLVVTRELHRSGRSALAGALLELLVPVAESATDLGSEDWVAVRELLVRLFPERREYRMAFVQAFEDEYGPTTPERAFFSVCRVMDSANPVAALDRLARLRRFAPGACVYHGAGWGVGEVVSVDPFLKQAVVNLEEKKNHRIAIDALDSILEPLDESGFRALLLRDRAALERLRDEEPVRLVDKLLDEFGDPMLLKELKARLVPDVIPSRSWTRWWNQTKNLLRVEGFYRVEDQAPQRVERLSTAVSFEEDLVDRYRRARWPQARSVARQVLRGGATKFPQAFPEMRASLLDLALRGDDPLAAIEAGALLGRFLSRDAECSQALVAALRRFSVAQIVGVLGDLQSGEGQTRILHAMLEARPEDGIDVLRGGAAGASDSVRDAAFAILDEHRPEVAAELVETYVSTPNRGAEAFCWLLEQALKGASRPCLRPLERRSARDRLVLLLDLVEHMADRLRRGGKLRHGQSGRDFAKRLETLLLGGDGGFFLAATEESTPLQRQEIHARLVRSAATLPQAATRLLELIGSRYPEVIAPEPTRPWEDAHAVYVTAEGLAGRKDELRALMEVRIPQNAEAIGKAAEFGDLSENAEFTSALEERDQLTRKAGHMREELEQARVIDPDLVPADEIGLGSRVRVRDLESGEELTYSILGPWDGTPDDGVLSYLSPLGQAFLGRAVGDDVHVALPGGTKMFRVLGLGSHFS